MKVLVPTLSMLIGALALGCAYDTTSPDAQPEGERLGSVSQPLNGWLVGETSAARSTDPGASLSLGMPTASTTCFLSGVAGNLSEGGFWQPWDIRSRVGVGGGGSTWGLFAHGGAYQNITNNGRNWADNPVLGRATCVGYPRYVPPPGSGLGAAWTGGAPRRIAPLGITFPPASPINRRCYLESITGGASNFTHSSDFVQVVRISVPDATHSTTGWYIEGSVQHHQAWGNARATAVCVDYGPGLEGEWTADVGVGNWFLTPGGTGVKACGLTRIKGAFDANDTANGVLIGQQAQINGNWTLAVSPGKSASVHCAQ